MRFVKFFSLLLVTTGLVYILNSQLTIGGNKTPVLGQFLHPQKGFWQNAEPSNQNFNSTINLKDIKANATVYFDDRLVPHINAQTLGDAYFVQGYLHAKFRLFQMEFQTHVAGGRLSEIVGTKGVAIDRYFTRLGMRFAAENALKYMEEDDELKAGLNAYTAGVNAYISNLNPKDYPIEYKILNYAPEAWTNLKTALFLKFMSYDLSGKGDDIMYQNAKTFFGYEDYMKIFPNQQDSLDPIVPKGTAFAKPAFPPIIPYKVDSNYLIKRDSFTVPRQVKPNPGNGSNNWAVDSTKTKSKHPILCNDPHLGLNLPSLWYEVQITTPEVNTYGASFPGSPAVIIGFNDSIAWGVTNAGRDVKDYYEMQFKDSSMKFYWFENDWVRADVRQEKIKVRDSATIVEKLAVTELGVVMYDKQYQTKNEDGKYIAVRWTAHDPSLELLTFMKLNKANNYKDYKDAISYFECPGQNFVFASKRGDIAITQQGKFVNKWNQQGDFLMQGIDSTYMWQSYIPYNENPMQLNPARGFVSSANQKAVDSSYPYYLGRASLFPPYRGYIINQKLANMNGITVDDMKALQTDNYNVFAQLARPFLLKYVETNSLSAAGKKYIDLFKDWNLNNAHDEKAASIFTAWWDSLEHEIFDDEFAQSKFNLPWPDESAILERLQKDSNFKYCNNLFTFDKKETITDCVNTAFYKACKALEQKEKENKLPWGKYKDTYVKHLLNIPAFNKLHLTNIGGGSHCINATTQNHGPSWRMIVHLSDEIKAYGVYPGGQNGNPGSKYYDNFVTFWEKGQYYKLLFVNRDAYKNNKNFKWQMEFKKV